MPEKWLGRGGFFPGTGWCLTTLGVHTRFIRYFGEFLGFSDRLDLAVDCFICYIFFFYLKQLNSERGRVFPLRCPDAGVGRDLPGGRVLMMGSRRFPG